MTTPHPPIARAAFSVLPLSIAEATLRQLPDAIAIVDSASHIVFANPAMERLLEAAEGELIGVDAVPALRTLSVNVDALRSGLDGRSLAPRRVERTVDGRMMGIELSIHPIEPDSALVCARDVTGRIEAEKRAHAQEEENESFRIVACLLAEETDLHEVLKLLAAQAASQCEGDGAAVIHIEADRGRTVATVGMLTPLHHHMYPALCRV